MLVLDPEQVSKLPRASTHARMLERSNEYLRTPHGEDAAVVNEQDADMRVLIEKVAKSLVDYPEQVVVQSVEGQQGTMLELKVSANDLGKIIGKQGRTARSIRSILNAASMKLKKRYSLEILE